MTKKIFMISGLMSVLTLGAVVSGTMLFSDNFGFASDDQNISAETGFHEKENNQIVNLNNVEKTQDNSFRMTENAPDYDTADKDTVFHMMLNSIDYYDGVSGTMIFTSDNVNVVNVVEFQSVLSQAISYSRFTQCSTEYTEDLNSNDLITPEFENIIYCKDGKKIDIVPDNKTYRYIDNSVITLDDAVPIDDEDRISVAEDGMPLYRFRNDPTNVLMSSMCLFPQDIAFGFLEDQDLWDITGIEESNDILCYQIHGNTSAEYGEKLNVSTFDFWVDVNTGVLVKYEGFDKNGDLSDFMYTKNLKYDESAESVSEFSENMIEGYSEIE